VTSLFLAPFRENATPPQADLTPLTAEYLSRLYLSPLTSVFDVCICERRACRTLIRLVSVVCRCSIYAVTSRAPSVWIVAVK
jgi:hypothetical protein